MVIALNQLQGRLGDRGYKGRVKNYQPCSALPAYRSLRTHGSLFEPVIYSLTIFMITNFGSTLEITHGSHQHMLTFVTAALAITTTFGQLVPYINDNINNSATICH